MKKKVNPCTHFIFSKYYLLNFINNFLFNRNTLKELRLSSIMQSIVYSYRKRQCLPQKSYRINREQACWSSHFMNGNRQENHTEWPKTQRMARGELTSSPKMLRMSTRFKVLRSLSPPSHGMSENTLSPSIWFNQVNHHLFCLGYSQTRKEWILEVPLIDTTGDVDAPHQS